MKDINNFVLLEYLSVSFLIESKLETILKVTRKLDKLYEREQ